MVSYIASRLGKKSDSDFSAPFRSILDYGHKADYLTRFVRFKGETRIQVGKSKRAWPLVVVYYNLYRRAQQPKGKYTMVRLPSKWMPIWQALMEVEAGSLVAPDEYKTPLPEGFSPLGQRLYDLWRVTLWARRRNPEYAKSSGFFEPGMFAMLLGAPKDHICGEWEILVMHGIVDSVGGNLFTIGEFPITPADLWAMEDGPLQGANESTGADISETPKSQNVTFRAHERAIRLEDQGDTGDGPAIPTFIKNGERTAHSEDKTESRSEVIV